MYWFITSVRRILLVFTDKEPTVYRYVYRYIESAQVTLLYNSDIQYLGASSILLPSGV